MIAQMNKCVHLFILFAISQKMELKVTVVIVLVFFQSLHCESRSISDGNSPDDDLIFAHTLCRHGERNLFWFYPNDPWGADEYWPGGIGELTNIGKQQHYMLGQYLRERYAILLGNGEYSADKVYVQSTNADRTLMSAQAAMAGLFPPNDNQRWNDDIDWQPVPVHTEPHEQDYRLVVEKPCDRYDLLMIEAQNSAEYQNVFKEYEPVLTLIEEKTGRKFPTLIQLALLYDALLIEKNKGYRLPSWAEEVWDYLEYFSFRAFGLWTTTPEMKKLRSGFLLKEILDHFTDKTQSTLSPDRSLWMYFAHDSTLTAMVNSIGLYTYLKPPTASCVLFELYQNNDDSYVQIFLRNSTTDNVPAFDVPGCGTKCPLNKLYEIYADILPTQSYEEECELRDGEYVPPDTRTEVFRF